jgi:hypothetical protein
MVSLEYQHTAAGDCVGGLPSSTNRHKYLSTMTHVIPEGRVVVWNCSTGKHGIGRSHGIPLSLGQVNDVGHVLTPEENSKEADYPVAIVPATMPSQPRLRESLSRFEFHTVSVCKFHDERSF